MTSRKIPLRKVAALWFGAFLFFLLLKNPTLASRGVSDGLILCANTIIPAIFPCSVLSEFLFRAVGSAGGRRRSIRGIPADGIAAFFWGALCGTPIGTRRLLYALDRGGMRRKTASALLPAVVLPSPAFLIGAVGIGMFGESRIGLALWIPTILTALPAAKIASLLFRKRRIPDAQNAPPPTDESAGDGARMLSEAVSSTVQSILTVCAYVILFSVLLAVSGAALGRLSDGETPLLALPDILLELTAGTRAASRVVPRSFSLPLAAFAAGWSGLSVHLQTLSLCRDRGLPAAPYFTAKAIQGLLCALLVLPVSCALGISVSVP